MCASLNDCTQAAQAIARSTDPVKSRRGHTLEAVIGGLRQKYCARSGKR
jgi:hypothetical protein